MVSTAPSIKEKTLKKIKSSGKRLSGFGQQLVAKQELKLAYRMREKQFRRFFEMARRSREDVGFRFLQLLEMRLDSVVYRLGWASSMAMARQMVSHGHVKVNGKKVNIPSFIVRVGDKIERKIDLIEKNKSTIKELPSEKSVPKWLKSGKKEGEVVSLPDKRSVPREFQEKVNLIVEFYSR